ncbi:MAG: divergent polysaccharide deacetylase family protein [Candidatus Eisenbacteria bacterium]
MVKRRSAPKQNRAPFILGMVAAGVLLLFLAGEMFAWATSDSGRLAVWRWLHMGERAHAVRIVGKLIDQGLSRAGISHDAVQSEVETGTGPSLHWKVTLPHDGAPLLVNHLVTRSVEAGGGAVLSGRERVNSDGALVVTMLVGVPGRPTHELELVRPGRSDDDAPPAVAKIALVLFAATEDESLLVAACARAEGFAVAATATGAGKSPVLRAAREHKREVVLFMPMEPENYPRVNPGPATLLVNMTGAKIEQSLRREIELASPVVAVANLMGSFATQDEPFMTAVYTELRRAHLPFLHIGAVPRSVCRTLASRVGAAYDEPDIMLDYEARRGSPKTLDKAWSDALERARKRGNALVLLRVTDRTAPWLERALSAKRLAGVELAPLSTVIRRPTAGH